MPPSSRQSQRIEPSHSVRGRPKPAHTAHLAVSRDTVLSIVADVAAETIDEHGPPSGELVYVFDPSTRVCATVDDCLPLSHALAVEEVGHLHWSALRAEPADPGAAPINLTILGSLIAAHVLHDLIDVRLAQRDHEVENLRIALETNRVIGVAVGIVMARQVCTREEAFELLRSFSQSQNRKLRDIAAQVQYTGTTPSATQVAS